MDDAQLARRFEIREAQVKLLSEHLGLSSPPFPGSVAPSIVADGTPESAAIVGRVPDEVIELARAGKTTQAISLYRRLTGATLLESKTIVEGL